MTRIQSKAPPIQQMPARERPSGEVAGKPFKDILNPKPVVEPRQSVRSTPGDTQPPARDSMPSETHAQQGWDASSRPGHEHSLAETATVVQSPVSAAAQPTNASASPGLDRMQARARGDQFKASVNADHVAETVGLVVEPAVTSMAFSAKPIPLPAPPLLSNVGAIVEPPIEAPSEIDMLAFGEPAAAASHVAEEAMLAQDTHGLPSPGTASFLSHRQAMPHGARGALLPRGDETAIEVPPALWCELPAPIEEASSAYSTLEPMAPVTEILTPQGGRIPELYASVVQSHVQASPQSVEGPLVPEAASQQIQAPVQLQTGMGPDHQNWILRPWRLQASGGLSYLSNGVQVGGSGDTSLLTGRISDDVRSRMATSALDMGEGGSLPARWRSVLRLPVHIESFTTLTEAEGLDPTDPMQAKGGHLAALAHWSQRMLRWSGNAATAGITAWVRDYALSASDVPALIDSLVALSTEQGFSLARIVVNGHEAWSAGKQHMTRGNHDGR